MKSPESVHRIQEALLPGDEIVKGMPLADIEKFGQMVDAHPGSADAKTVLFIKHHHGREDKGPQFLAARSNFDKFLAHQDAVFGSLCLLADCLTEQDRLRVVVEILTPGQPVMSQSVASSIADVQKRRDRYQLNVLERIYQKISAGGQQAAWARAHIHGGLRFVAREVLADRFAQILPGRVEMDDYVISRMLQEFNTLGLAAAQTGSINEGELARVVQEHEQRYRADHELRHAFVREGIDHTVAPGMLGVVLYGQEHFSGGATPVPMENAFPEYRSFVFEPYGLHSLQMPKNDPHAVWLDPGAFTVEDARSAIAEALGWPRSKQT